MAALSSSNPLDQLRSGTGVAHLALAAVLLLYPLFASDFFTFQIGGYSLILGTIALSLMMLIGYGGIVSMAQVSIAGLAGYLVAILGDNSTGVHGFGWPWWLVVPIAVVAAATFSALIGAIASRTDGIYTIMITLAISVVFFYFTRQNYEIFNGFTGFNGIKPPVVFGYDLIAPTTFYYLCLAVAGLCYTAVLYGARSTFGLTFQGVRDNARRMQTLGFNPVLHRIFAHLLAGVIAGVGGVLLVWFGGRISPGTIGIDVTINILIIAVVGGVIHPIGPFVGALVFVLLETFAIDFIAPERFNTLIGLVFLSIVFCSPNGLVGIWNRFMHGVRGGTVKDVNQELRPADQTKIN